MATWFAWFVLLVLFSAGVILIVLLGSLPGQIARGRNHPHASAIQVAGWLGLALGGVGWPLALIWAFVPVSSEHHTKAESAEMESLRRRVDELQSALDSLIAGKSGPR
ncbi:MAG: DUF3302 domain-containing protein [Pirellulaceae bacterium]